MLLTMSNDCYIHMLLTMSSDCYIHCNVNNDKCTYGKEKRANNYSHLINQLIN